MHADHNQIDYYRQVLSKNVISHIISYEDDKQSSPKCNKIYHRIKASIVLSRKKEKLAIQSMPDYNTDRQYVFYTYYELHYPQNYH